MNGTILIVPIRNNVNVDAFQPNEIIVDFNGNHVQTSTYDVFTTRTFLTQSQIYEEDGEVFHAND